MVNRKVELMCMQLRRVKLQTDTRDMELTMDVMVVLSNKDDRNAAGFTTERLAKTLALQIVEDSRTETISIKKLLKERGQSAESNQQILNLLNKCRKIAGLKGCDVLHALTQPEAFAKCL